MQRIPSPLSSIEDERDRRIIEERSGAERLHGEDLATALELELKQSKLLE
jgi:hypothetical protein